MNEQILKGEWQELKGEVQKSWGKLTDSDLDQIKGDRSRLEGLIRQKYGHSVEQVRKEVDQVINRYDNLSFTGQWNQIKGEIQKTWGDITENDVDKVNGSRTRLAGLIQQKYAKTKKEAYQEVNKFLKQMA